MTPILLLFIILISNFFCSFVGCTNSRLKENIDVKLKKQASGLIIKSLDPLGGGSSEKAQISLSCLHNDNDKECGCSDIIQQGSDSQSVHLNADESVYETISSVQKLDMQDTDSMVPSSMVSPYQDSGNLVDEMLDGVLGQDEESRGETSQRGALF